VVSRENADITDNLQLMFCQRTQNFKKNILSGHRWTTFCYQNDQLYAPDRT